MAVLNACGAPHVMQLGLTIHAGLLQPEEEFFVCKWSTNTTTGAPLLLLAGFTGTIRVVDCNLRKVVWVRTNLCFAAALIQSCWWQKQLVRTSAQVFTEVMA